MAHKKRKRIKLNKRQQILACVLAVVLLLGILLASKILDDGGVNVGDEPEGETLPFETTQSVETT